MRPLIWPQIATLALISAALLSPALAQTPPADQTPAVEELEGAPPAEPQTIPPLPVAVDPPTPAVVVNLTWLEQPTAQDFARYYPDRAKYEGVDGRATLDCLVNADGRLSCTIVSEEPEGWGFGEATLRVARHFRIAPTTRDGTPTVGGRIRRTIRWMMN